MSLMLEFDSTGIAANNLITDVYAPATGVKRLIVPKHGDFFLEGIVIVDNQTNQPVDSSLWRCRDIQTKYLYKVEGEVYSHIELDAATPADLRVTLQYVGGEGSLSAKTVLDWIAAQNRINNTVLPYNEIINAPKAWVPKHHKQLLEHIYFLNPVIDSIRRVKDYLKVDSHDEQEHIRESIDRRLNGLRDRAELSIEGLVHKYMALWELDLNTYHLGLDSINNYGLMTEQQALGLADLNFVVDDVDDKYVDLRGLGKFSKRLFDQYVQAGTGLGNRYAMLRDASRGNILAAKVGEIYQIPAPHEALDALSRWPHIWPSDYPDNHPFVVSKVGGNENDLGGVLMGYDPINGNSWTGFLRYEDYAFRIHWVEQFNEQSLLQIGEVFDKHFNDVGAVHKETAANIGLSELENRKLVSIDEVLSRSNSEGLHTVASFLYLLRAAIEGVELPLDENGLVDLESNPMLQPKIIYAPCEPVDYSIEAPQRTWCEGSSYWGTFKGPDGVLREVKIQEESPACQEYKILPHGTSLGKFCDTESFSMKERFSDGKGNTYIETIKANDPDCGFKLYPEKGTVVSEYCEGVNRIREIATGTGSTQKTVWMANTYLCNGTRGEGGTGQSGGDTGTPGSPNTSVMKIELKTTHTNIYIGTQEIISVKFTGFAPKTEYTSGIWNKSSAYNDNKPLETFIFTVKTDADGMAYFELPREDNGIVPRSAVDTWIYMESTNTESNHVVRNFLPGEDPRGGEPDGDPIEPPDTGLKDDDGTPVPPNTDVNGNDRGTQPWPPMPVYNPSLSLSSNLSIIYPNDVEQLTATASGFWANREYTIDFWTSLPGSGPLKTHSATVMTDSYGNASYIIHVRDDGAIVPRGDNTNWVTMGNVTSPSVVRTFKAGTKPNTDGPVAGILYTSSHAVVGIGTAYTETVMAHGLKANTKYTLLFKGGYYGAYMQGGERGSAVLISDAQGKIHFERTLTEEGLTAEASWTLTAYLSEGNTHLRSNDITVVFRKYTLNTPSNGVPRLDYETSRSILKVGDSERHTVRLTNGEANKTYTVHFLISGPNINNGVELVTHSPSITTNALGTGTYILDNVDDGIMPRGDYNSWVTVPELYAKSSAIVRSFVNADGSTGPKPGTGNKQVSFGSSHTVVEYGTVETHTTSISGFDAAKTYEVHFMAQSSALNNGGVPIRTASSSITTNSRGEGTNSFDIREAGNTPAGDYLCWATVDGIDSPPVTRTFLPRVVNYSPTTSWSTSHTTISRGVNETITMRLAGGKPNTRYTLEFWNQSSAVFSGLPVRMLSINVVTDANGNASYSHGSYDDGVVVPRGTYACWTVIAETGAQSTVINRNFVGPATTTTMTFNPTCSYWTSSSVMVVGTRETHNFSIAGCRPNTAYSLEFWINGGGLGNYHTHTERLVTNASGSAAGSFGNVDDGVMPRGSYRCWVAITGTTATSSEITRTFL